MRETPESTTNYFDKNLPSQIANYERLTRFAQQALQQAATLIPERKVVLPETLLYVLLQNERSESTQLVNAAEANPAVLSHQLHLNWNDAANAARLRLTLGENDLLTSEVKQALTLAEATAVSEKERYLTTRHLLMGLLQTNTFAAHLLGKNGVTLDYLRLNRQPRAGEIELPAAATGSTFAVSPIFWLLLAATAAAGWFSYANAESQLARVFTFGFVVGGWVLSVALHEYGHALAAYIGGDSSVARKGYLSLNPLKYTHLVTSIIFPVIILLMGGIGLPGGAVYIEIGRIRSRWWRMLTAAAGPIASAICALLLWIPFRFLVADTAKAEHLEFWAGWALLLYIEVTAVFFNLLPIPGLDGYNIVSQLLPISVQQALASVSRYTFLIIMLVFFQDNPLRRAFGGLLNGAWDLLQIDQRWVGAGYFLFRFWEG